MSSMSYPDSAESTAEKTELIADKEGETERKQRQKKIDGSEGDMLTRR